MATLVRVDFIRSIFMEVDFSLSLGPNLSLAHDFQSHKAKFKVSTTTTSDTWLSNYWSEVLLVIHRNCRIELIRFTMSPV